jgi:hypothetical protein
MNEVASERAWCVLSVPVGIVEGGVFVVAVE